MQSNLADFAAEVAAYRADVADGQTPEQLRESYGDEFAAVIDHLEKSQAYYAAVNAGDAPEELRSKFPDFSAATDELEKRRAAMVNFEKDAADGMPLDRLRDKYKGAEFAAALQEVETIRAYETAVNEGRSELELNNRFPQYQRETELLAQMDALLAEADRGTPAAELAARFDDPALAETVREIRRAQEYSEAVRSPDMSIRDLEKEFPEFIDLTAQLNMKLRARRDFHVAVQEVTAEAFQPPSSWNDAVGPAPATASARPYADAAAGLKKLRDDYQDDPDLAFELELAAAWMEDQGRAYQAAADPDNFPETADSLRALREKLAGAAPEQVADLDAAIEGLEEKQYPQQRYQAQRRQAVAEDDAAELPDVALTPRSGIDILIARNRLKQAEDRVADAARKLDEARAQGRTDAVAAAGNSVSRRRVSRDPDRFYSEESQAAVAAATADLEAAEQALDALRTEQESGDALAALKIELDEAKRDLRFIARRRSNSRSEEVIAARTKVERLENRVDEAERLLDQVDGYDLPADYGPNAGNPVMLERRIQAAERLHAAGMRMDAIFARFLTSSDPDGDLWDKQAQVRAQGNLGRAMTHGERKQAEEYLASFGSAEDQAEWKAARKDLAAAQRSRDAVLAKTGWRDAEGRDLYTAQEHMFKQGSLEYLTGSKLARPFDYEVLGLSASGLTGIVPLVAQVVKSMDPVSPGGRSGTAWELETVDKSYRANLPAIVLLPLTVAGTVPQLARAVALPIAQRAALGAGLRIGGAAARSGAARGARAAYGGAVAAGRFTAGTLRDPAVTKEATARLLQRIAGAGRGKVDEAGAAAAGAVSRGQAVAGAVRGAAAGTVRGAAATGRWTKRGGRWIWSFGKEETREEALEAAWELAISLDLNALNLKDAAAQAVAFSVMEYLDERINGRRRLGRLDDSVVSAGGRNAAQEHFGTGAGEIVRTDEAGAGARPGVYPVLVRDPETGVRRMEFVSGGRPAWRGPDGAGSDGRPGLRGGAERRRRGPRGRSRGRSDRPGAGAAPGRRPGRRDRNAGRRLPGTLVAGTGIRAGAPRRARRRFG